jgi:lipopolysaccharide transport system permease protein
MYKKIIEADKNLLRINLKELYQYRDLFLSLSWRDFRVRYAQTSVGFLWAVLQPITTIFILNIVFGNFVEVKTPVPHLLYTVSGMSIWTYYSYVMTNSGNSIITSQNMIKKIYFPRLVIPLSKAVVGLIDLLITLLIFFVLMIYYHITPSSNVWFGLFFILIGMISALSVGIWLSALTVRYRDFQHVIPFLVQIGMYITPIAYPMEFVTKKLPQWAQTIYFLNPMIGVLQGFRWSVFGGEAPGNMFWISIFVVFFMFISGIYYFRKIEGQMADFV